MTVWPKLCYVTKHLYHIFHFVLMILTNLYLVHKMRYLYIFEIMVGRKELMQRLLIKML